MKNVNIGIDICDIERYRIDTQMLSVAQPCCAELRETHSGVITCITSPMATMNYKWNKKEVYPFLTKFLTDKQKHFLIFIDCKISLIYLK